MLWCLPAVGGDGNPVGGDGGCYASAVLRRVGGSGCNKYVNMLRCGAGAAIAAICAIGGRQRRNLLQYVNDGAAAAAA